MHEHFEQLLDRTLHQEKNPDTHIEHSLTFLSIALQIKAKSILELGTREGGSTYPFLVASKILGGKLTSIDIETPGYEAPEDLKPYWNFIKSDALEFLDSNTERFDLIYVDDWHSYAHVKKELEYIDRVSDRNTIILLHDLMGMSSHPYYFYPKDEPDTSEWGEGGPFRAVMELDLNRWEWATIPVCHGLTILRKTV
jgi:predicted O-methyltransferase YrrM